MKNPRNDLLNLNRVLLSYTDKNSMENQAKNHTRDKTSQNENFLKKTILGPS